MSRLLVALTLAAAWLPAAEPLVDEVATADEAILKGAGVAGAAPALLDFFRKRTLSQADRNTVAALVRQLGSESFDDREDASKRLPAYGTTILPVLRLRGTRSRLACGASCGRLGDGANRDGGLR